MAFVQAIEIKELYSGTTLASKPIMDTSIVTFWVPADGPRATMMVRRPDGRIALAGIDARVARAAGLAHALTRDSQFVQDERVFFRALPVALETA
jgi:hypothetical protein